MDNDKNIPVFLDSYLTYDDALGYLEDYRAMLTAIGHQKDYNLFIKRAGTWFAVYIIKRRIICGQ
jgi:hypothetical protein